MTEAPTVREKYIELATAGFAAEGYAGLSLAALAKTAGVTKQALLHHFRTKDALYQATLDGLTQRLLTAMDELPDVSPKMQFVLHFQYLLGGDPKRSQDARLTMRAILDNPESAQAALAPYLDRLLTLAGSVKGKAEVPSTLLRCQLMGLITAGHTSLILRETLVGQFGDTAKEDVLKASQCGFAAHLKKFLGAR